MRDVLDREPGQLVIGSHVPLDAEACASRAYCTLLVDKLYSMIGGMLLAQQ